MNQKDIFFIKNNFKKSYNFSKSYMFEIDENYMLVSWLEDIFKKEKRM